jgi:hypothetical protein
MASGRHGSFAARARLPRNRWNWCELDGAICNASETEREQDGYHHLAAQRVSLDDTPKSPAQAPQKTEAELKKSSRE